MLVALASLTLFVTLWLVIVVMAATLEATSGKIVAALTGHSLLAAEQPLAEVRVRVSQRYSTDRRPVRALPELRAAA